MTVQTNANAHLAATLAAQTILPGPRGEAARAVVARLLANGPRDECAAALARAVAEAVAAVNGD